MTDTDTTTQDDPTLDATVVDSPPIVQNDAEQRQSATASIDAVTDAPSVTTAPPLVDPNVARHDDPLTDSLARNVRTSPTYNAPLAVLSRDGIHHLLNSIERRLLLGAHFSIEQAVAELDHLRAYVDAHTPPAA